MALTLRDLEERLKVVKARLKEGRSELELLTQDAEPSARERELRAERKELEFEYDTLRGVLGPGRGEPLTPEEEMRKREAERQAFLDELDGRTKKGRPPRPFWVKAFWFVIHLIGAAGGSPDVDEIPGPRATLFVILGLLAVGGLIALAISL